MINLAGVSTCDTTIRGELREARIDAYRLPFMEQSEVPSQIVGVVAGWQFRRAWYYWVCSGPGLPIETSNLLYAFNKNDIRVDGHCGCPAPDEYKGGFSVGLYHVDSQLGLNTLAQAIKSVMLKNIEQLDGKSIWSKPIDPCMLLDRNS